LDSNEWVTKAESEYLSSVSLAANGGREGSSVLEPNEELLRQDSIADGSTEEAERDIETEKQNELCEQKGAAKLCASWHNAPLCKNAANQSE